MSSTHQRYQEPVYIDRTPAPVNIPDEPMVAPSKTVETTTLHYNLIMYLWIYPYSTLIQRTVLTTLQETRTAFHLSGSKCS